MLSVGGPLRLLKRGTFLPLRTLSLECRQFHTTPRLLKSNDDEKPPSPTPSDSTPPPSDTPTTTTKNKDSEFWTTLFSPKGGRKGRDTGSLSAAGEGEGEEGDRTLVRETEMVKEQEEQKLVKKFQKRGDWDKVEVRKEIHKTHDRRKRGGRFLKQEIPGDKNQTYTVGNYKLSIEDVDEEVLQKQREMAEDEAASVAHTVRDRKEETILADESPELVDVLLDRPSQADSTIASIQGKELFEFTDEKELEEFEAGKGKSAEKKMTRADAKVLEMKKRGPAMKKNEFGADQLTLLYDEQPPRDRAIVPFKDPLKKLKYMPIYPPKIKKWVTYLRHSKGRYNMWGYWENDPELQEQEEEKREQMKIRARESGDSGILVMEEKKKQQHVPIDLEGHYRFGVQPEELVGVHPKVKELLSFKHANNEEIHAFRKKQLIKRWQERPDDHGTPQVQIAMMTNRIEYLTEHLRKHRKDKVSRLRLRLLISKRQSLLQYLQKKNVPVYFQLIKEMNIKDISF